MKKMFPAVVALFIAFFTVTAGADMAAYVNAGVSNLNPTIGLNAEFQYGYASIAVGAGIMTYNNFGFGAGLRGYLFGIDGGPYLEVIYGISGEKAYTHIDSSNRVVVDSVEVFTGISALAGWRLFFADGWNMTLGAGAAEAGGKGIFVFNVTAGAMVWGDEAAEKNAGRYSKSYEPMEEGLEESLKDIPEISEQESAADDLNTDTSVVPEPEYGDGVQPVETVTEEAAPQPVTGNVKQE